MKRRTLLLGMGSLAASGAVALGTGSVSSVRAERNITGRVAGDGRAYLEFRAGDANGFAVENLDGEMRLAFNNDPSGGNGLNRDSVSSFDDAFRLNNTGTEDLRVFIEDSKDRVEFYFAEQISDEGAGDDDTERATLAPGADPLSVGVRIDLRDVAPSNVFGGADDDFTVVAEDAAENA
jgi:hypothetical protein